MAIFDVLIKRASQFVEKQKGVWDHAAWLGFLSDIEKIGIDLTEEMQNNLGLVLVFMSKFYETSTDSDKMIFEKVSEQTAMFVEQTKGTWDHLGWENFVKDLQQKGIHLTEETTVYLGEVLESTKNVYSSLPLTAKEEKK